VQWDVGNSVREGESIRDTWANIGDRAIYLQLKDMALGSDGAWSYVPFGEGDMPIGEILDLIVSDGFDGWLSYEWEKWWYPELAAAEDELPRFIGHIRELRGG
jgi:sugar phosphate isomerase/epimerase